MIVMSRGLWLCALALACSATAWPQAPAGPLHPNPDAKPEIAPQRAIRRQVNEVIAPVVVRDSSGEMILNLSRDQFHVFDNGVEQKIDHFDLGGDPLSIVLVVEASNHIAPMFPAVRRLGIVFSEAVMGQTSEAAVISYDNTIDLLQKFTTDVDGVQSVIENLRMGTAGMRLYDGMARGIALLEQRPPVRRRILVVIGEARDEESESKLGEVLREAQLANVTIYSIGLSTTMADLRAKNDPYEGPQLGPPGTYPVPLPPGVAQTPENEAAMAGNVDLMAVVWWLVRTGKNAIGPNSLAIASKATGGLHKNPKKDESIEKALDEIGGELHAQYTLGYRPTGDEPSGYHEIKIVVDQPHVTVRTRPGYYIAPPES
jgi:VWFA-related protein